MRRAIVAVGIATAVAALATGLTATRDTAQNFSQHPGFTDHYAARPARATLPTLTEQELLRRFRPHVFLPPGHAGLPDAERPQPVEPGLREPIKLCVGQII